MEVIHGKKTDIEVVRSYAFNKGGKLLSTSYENALIKLDWECSQGHKFSTTFNHVKNRGQWCPVCGKEKVHAALIKRMQDPANREKLSKSHLKRLKQQGKYCGKTQRQVASRLRDHLSGLIRNPSKHKSVLKYLGCSLQKYLDHLESQFLDGMTWENRGQYGWHIDHIIPLSAFDLTDEAEIYKACHYTNLRPLWAKDNLKKAHHVEVTDV